MQIQRLQTLWLIIALLLAIVSLCFPWLKIDHTTITVENDIPLLILTLLATILPIAAICVYRNLRRQKLICGLATLMAIFSIGYCVSLSYLGPDPQSEVCVLAPTCMALSAIFDLLARRAAIHDENLLRSANRIR